MTRAAAAAALLLAALGVRIAVEPPPLPSYAEVRARHQRSEAVLLDRFGRPLHERRVDAKTRALDWTPLDAVSENAVAAVLAAEDRRFYSHAGADWRGLAGAAVSTARGRPRGASTITMQLAARLRPELAPRGLRRSPLQKLRQIAAARALERSWTKRQVLEAYLNLVCARGELRGVSAVSRGLFRRSPDALTRGEALTLAALLREPGAPLPRVERRARRLAAVLGWADVPAAPALSPLPSSVALAPHVARRLLPSGARAARVVRSTLDADIQRAAARALAERLDVGADRNMKDGAVLVVDNATGEVLAYVGNSGGGSSARFVDGAQARRQAGSTLKPFLYALAFDRRVATPASLLDDSPLELPTARGVFRPEDYDRRFRGPIPAKEALAGSVNVPAVRLLALAGPEALLERLRELGFTRLDDADSYGPSLALGTPDVTLWELAGAFRALAEGGVYRPLTLTPGTRRGGRRVFSAGAAFLVADALSDRESRAATFGLESPLATPYWTAVKTGTSKDMRDNWCVGFSRRYTVAVWVGNFSGEPMWNVSGVTGAAPLWREVMDALHASEAGPPPAPPSGVVRAGERWYLAGTEPSAATAPAPPAAAVASPAPGTIFALDPDIPADAQRLVFRARGAAAARWRLDEKDLGPADAETEWAPEPGKHLLALVDARGGVLDSAPFEVRGAAIPEPLSAETEPEDDASDPR